MIAIGAVIIRYKSISMAERALEELKNNGYNGYIKRTSPMGGGSCGFAVYVEGANDKAVMDLVKRNGL